MTADIVGNRTLKSQWDETVAYYGENIFLKFISKEEEEFSYSYNTFDGLVRRAANFFLKCGFRKGEPVALHMHNMPEYLVCWLALAQIGVVSVPLNSNYKPEECKYIIDKCGIKHIIAERSLLDIYIQNRDCFSLSTLILADGAADIGEQDNASSENIPGNETDIPKGVLSLRTGMARESAVLTEDIPVDGQDEAVILFTSGTTRYPKGVIYTHCNVIYGGVFHAQQIGLCPGDRFLTAMPCYHMDFQEMEAASVICSGSTLIMLEHYSAHRFWKQICSQRANFTDLMSIMNRTLMLQPVQPWEKDHCLKQVYFSMGLSNEEKEAFEERFNVRLLNSYGMTETVSAVTCVPLYGDQHWPSVGRPALSYEIKIIDKNGNELPPNTEGEICVSGIRGHSLVKGYYQDEEADAKLFPEEGWLHSGDWGYLDEDGWLYFLGRCGHMIKRSGENISCLEVECTLTSHPLIVDAAVVGVPDPIRDMSVRAYIQPAKDASLDADQIIQYCRERLADFKVPSQIVFVKDFQRTATGKIIKDKLPPA